MNKNISSNTLSNYNRSIREILKHKQKYTNNIQAIIELYIHKTPHMQRIMYYALCYYQKDLCLSLDDLKLLQDYNKVQSRVNLTSPITDEQMTNLLLLLDTKANIKQKVCMEILIYTGVRKHEVEQVVQGYLKKPGDSVVIMGKGHKNRKVLLTQQIIDSLELCKDRYGSVKMARLFYSQYVYRTVKKFFNKIGYEGACHDLRRHFAQNLERKGARLSQLQALMGHNSIETTQIYLQQNESELRDIIERQDELDNVLDIEDTIKILRKLERAQKKITQQKLQIKQMSKTISRYEAIIAKNKKIDKTKVLEEHEESHKHLL